ncbi:MAG: arsenate reductase ArsC [Nitrospirae bacterium]|nr:arsenate reductase ArsC [Nitrospirota bacterium]
MSSEDLVDQYGRTPEVDGVRADEGRSSKRVLFLCVENANRSQMAEAFANLLGGSQVQAYSAGSRPSGTVNPRAIESMDALGYNLAAHRSKSLKDVPQVEYDAVVSMGCGDACPFMSAKLREQWDIPDPREMGPEEFRRVRDTIRAKVADLLSRL